VGLANPIAQQDTFTIGGTVATGNLVIVQINQKQVSYTATGTDTTTSIATSLQALLSASTYPEFQEIAWNNPSAGVVTATCNTPGLPFVATCGSSGEGPASAVVASGGSGYSVSDVVTVSGGTYLSPATFTVATLSGSALATVTLLSPGVYYTLPSNPVSLTGGHGTSGTLTLTAAGGASITQTHPQICVSPNDAGNPLNWVNSAGASGLPITGDSIVFANSAVSLLYNLPFASPALTGVTVTSITVWQNYTGSIGLIDNNPAGYVEYRPTYFSIGATVVTVGLGQYGTGSGLIRLNFGSVQVAANILNAGSPVSGSDYAVRLLGTNASNTLTVSGGSVGIAMLQVSILSSPGVEIVEAATFATVVVQSAGTLDLGPGCTLTTVTEYGTTLNIRAGCTTLTLNGGNGLISAGSATFTSVVMNQGASVTWVGSGTITGLNMSGGSTLNQSTDPTGRTITNSTITGDCTVNDPYNATTWTNATTISGPIASGVFIIGPGRTVKVT
jgi:hypothetical protein